VDASTISAGYTGAKIAVQTVQTIIGTKAEIAADGRVIAALEQLGTIQDTYSSCATGWRNSKKKTTLCVLSSAHKRHGTRARHPTNS